MQYVQYRQTDAHDRQIVICDLHRRLHRRRGTRYEQSQQESAKAQHARRDHNRCDQCDHHSRPHTVMNAPDLSGAHILPHVCHHGITVGCRRDLQQTVQLVGRRKPSDKNHAKSVYHSLYDHAAHRYDRILKRHGKTQIHQFSRQSAAQPEILRLHAQQLDLSDMPDAKDA